MQSALIVFTSTVIVFIGGYIYFIINHSDTFEKVAASYIQGSFAVIVAIIAFTASRNVIDAVEKNRKFKIEDDKRLTARVIYGLSAEIKTIVDTIDRVSMVPMLDTALDLFKLGKPAPIIGKYLPGSYFSIFEQNRSLISDVKFFQSSDAETASRVIDWYIRTQSMFTIFNHWYVESVDAYKKSNWETGISWNPRLKSEIERHKEELTWIQSEGKQLSELLNKLSGFI